MASVMSEQFRLLRWSPLRSLIRRESMVLTLLDRRWSTSQSVLFMSSWSANSGSQNLPSHSTRIYLLLKANRQMRPYMQGNDMQPKGRETGLAVLMKAQAMLPPKKRIVVVTRQTFVLRLVSNLLRQEKNMPGQTIAVTGTQPHFWPMTGLMVGICISKGQLYLLMKSPLQLSFSLTYNITMTTTSMIRRVKQERPASLREVNLRHLTSPTTMQKATTSFMIMLSLLNHQPMSTPTPTTIDMAYRILNQKLPIANICLLIHLILSRKISQLQQIATQMIPRTNETTVRHTLMPFSEKYPMAPPMMTQTSKMTIIQILYSMPCPPSDHALENIARMTIAAVQTTISTKRPIQTVLVLQLLLQRTQYETVQQEELEQMLSSIMSKQLYQCTSELESTQLLVMLTSQGVDEQVLKDKLGLRISQRVCT